MKPVTPENCPRLEGWTTATEISDLLGISRQTVNQMFWAGEFGTLHRLGPDSRKPFLVVKTSEFEKIRATRLFPRSKTATREES